MLGHSRDYALQRFYSQERRLMKNYLLRLEYKKFMDEYLSMNHMIEIDENSNDEELNFYYPHHAVIREDSTTTRVRIVFDASLKTDSGLSFNDVQHVGPTLQNELFVVLIRFRLFNYVMTGDISKMYRMIWIDPSQTRFQRIFWRSHGDQKVKCFELKTVTYGNSSSPYLAIKCLHQLATEHSINYPSAAKSIKNSFYVDDYLAGANTEQELLKLQYEVTKILSEGGFHLRKWRCNNSLLLDQFQMNEKLESNILKIGENEACKTLGVLWNSSSDIFLYSQSTFDTKVITKRIILSELSQIFDPLGFIGPIIVKAKLLVQTLWKLKLSWDETLPESLQQNWMEFRSGLSGLKFIQIPRHVLMNEYETIELHGFGDASEKAYGCCIYLRCKSLDGKYQSRLLCARSRVAPTKPTTLPRLELCAALLLIRMIEKVRESLEINFDTVYLWSDSTITLAWIKAPANRWKTFVANRVSEIQELSNVSDWHHVASGENPADLLSRGTSVENLKESSLWWTGPSWLNDEITILGDSVSLEHVPEERHSVNLSISVDIDFTNRFSTLTKLQRVIAFCLRFIFNCKIKNNRKTSSILSSEELHISLHTVLKVVQKEVFKQEYQNLENNVALNRKSKLISLNPFMDNEQLIRVGGRLKHCNLGYGKKHPIILPAKHKITKLIFQHEHIKLLHCGPTMLLSSIRDRYWPIAGRNMAKKTVRECVTCFKVQPVSPQYLMGNLPEFRINQYFPFFNTGVDYAGPFLLKDRNTRGAKLMKGYVCLFICLSTKAIHLEAVSELNTKGFLATLKRFISRRGKPLNIYSDNGTNFVGASAELKKLQQYLSTDSENINNYLASENITWHFIPARSPNFGGIWEAGIKRAKFHLKRVVGNAHLNFEDFSTILTQIESILNSRPLCPLTSNPDDTNPLTPAHFLVGRRLTGIPEPSYADVPENRLRRFERIQNIIQHFWSRWQKEYISELQVRVKWKNNAYQLLQIGALVLVKEDNIPPFQWPLGRITQLHPGDDGVTRVVSVKVRNNIVKRAVSRICVLPVD